MVLTRRRGNHRRARACESDFTENLQQPTAASSGKEAKQKREDRQKSQGPGHIKELGQHSLPMREASQVSCHHHLKDMGKAAEAGTTGNKAFTPRTKPSETTPSWSLSAKISMGAQKCLIITRHKQALWSPIIRAPQSTGSCTRSYHLPTSFRSARTNRQSSREEALTKFQIEHSKNTLGRSLLGSLNNTTHLYHIVH